jgi:hypothetical protein
MKIKIVKYYVLPMSYTIMFPNGTISHMTFKSVEAAKKLVHIEINTLQKHYARMGKLFVRIGSDLSLISPLPIKFEAFGIFKSPETNLDAEPVLVEYISFHIPSYETDSPIRTRSNRRKNNRNTSNSNKNNSNKNNSNKNISKGRE